MKLILTTILLSVLLTGCDTIPKGPPIAPAAAIQLAEKNPFGVVVKVQFQVCRVDVGHGRDAGRVFLDSESDYRSPKSLNVVLVDDAVKIIGKKVDGDFRRAYLNQIIEVTSTVERVKIGTVVNGEVTSPFYYQTQMEISDPSRIDIISNQK